MKLQFKRFGLALRRKRDNLRYKSSRRERQGRHDFFNCAFKALAFNGIDGDYAEFGSHGALTFSQAFHEATRHKHNARLWAFDSFQGLPTASMEKDEHPMWVGGEMATSLSEFHTLCRLRGIDNNRYNVVPGYFNESLPALGDSADPNNICLAYVDCDLYSSTMDVLKFLLPRLKHGMIVAFDDYHCWSATTVSGERLAMLEVFSPQSRWQLTPYMNIGWHGASFIVEDTALIMAEQRS
ncbi:MAG: TylF/MycF/NovP-related O-methyltransferase [Granulosicoccus sp.]